MMRVMVLVLSLVSVGCVTTGQPRLPYGLPISIGPGDIVEMTWSGGKVCLEVAGDGTLRHKLFGTVEVAGRTVPEVQKILRSAAKRIAQKETLLTIRLVKSQNAFVYVYGEVKTSGRYPFKRGMKLLDAISLAGGYIAGRASSSVRLVRRTHNKRYIAHFDIAELLCGEQKDPPLEPGDILYVPTSFMTKVADTVAYILQPIRSLIESLLGVASSAAKATATTTPQ